VHANNQIARTSGSNYIRTGPELGAFRRDPPLERGEGGRTGTLMTGALPMRVPFADKCHTNNAARAHTMLTLKVDYAEALGVP
jgi:hypothetical protein